ncbi:MAG TPA: hypothetical protein VGG85_00320 [Terracidiphilus sp.]
MFFAHLSGHVFLALPLEKRHYGNLIFLGKPFYVGHKGTGHRLHGISRRDLCFLLVADVTDGSLRDLQAGNNGIEIHAIDAFHFQRHVFAQYIGGGVW